MTYVDKCIVCTFLIFSGLATAEDVVNKEDKVTTETLIEKPAETSRKTSTKTAYIIETQVQGTQEQPNVIYITPWQVDEQSVEVDEKILEINLAEIKPVSPENFKRKVQFFHLNKTEHKIN